MFHPSPFNAYDLRTSEFFWLSLVDDKLHYMAADSSKDWLRIAPSRSHRPLACLRLTVATKASSVARSLKINYVDLYTWMGDRQGRPSSVNPCQTVDRPPSLMFIFGQLVGMLRRETLTCREHASNSARAKVESLRMCNVIARRRDVTASLRLFSIYEFYVGYYVQSKCSQISMAWSIWATGGATV